MSPTPKSTIARRLALLAVFGALGVGGSQTLQPAAVHAAAADAADATVIEHMLHRLGFGPRPGQVDEVRRLGLDAWIERQLHPDRIDDRALDATLATLPTLGMSTEDLVSRYFRPAFELRRKIQQSSAAAGEPAAAPAGEADGSPTMAEPGMMADTSMRDAARARQAVARAALTPDEFTRFGEAQRGVRQVMLDLSAQKILRATYSERQLQEVLVDFWFNHFNVFAGKPPVQPYVSGYERDVIRPRVLGSFRDLLGAVAKSPAMLVYLDNWQSAAASDAPVATARPGVRRRGAMGGRQDGRIGGGQDRRRAAPEEGRRAGRRGLNENYARELLELHTLGVDGGYTQQDIQHVARAFTGWTVRNPREGGGFVFVPRIHDAGSKVVLGTTLRAGQGQQDGEQVLDLLARHPSTATFIATKLARRLVADEPPPALVARAAAAFRATDGNLREVVRVIVTAPEMRDPAVHGAKMKSPFEFVVSALRETDAVITDTRALTQQLRSLGMPLYFAQPPTGYPELSHEWVNTGTLLDRMNFAVALTGGRIGGVRVASLASAEASALALGSPDFQQR